MILKESYCICYWRRNEYVKRMGEDGEAGRGGIE